MSRSKALSIRAFLPARDLAVSRRFYQDLGFQEIWGDDSACGMHLDGCEVILQQYYVKEHAENFMMSLNVEDVDAWWRHVESAGLKEKYGLGMARPPAMQPWGFRVLYLTDPAGVLWHIAEYSHA
jgi:uncharacterized glyoxalase superfamily protein PhnB